MAAPLAGTGTAGESVMSVVNRMLQDIDRLNAAGHTATESHPPPRNVSARRSRRGVPRILVIAGVGGVVVASAFAVTVWRDRPANPLPIVAPIVVPAPYVPYAPAVPARAVVTMVSPDMPDSPVAEPVTAPPPVEIQHATVAKTSRGVPLGSTDALKLSMKLSALVDDLLASMPAKEPIPASVVTPAPLPGKTTITNLPVRQIAAEETIASARAQWNDGAHAAALATMRESLAAAEATRNARATALLGRELARMEVADNRPQAALDLLRRLENVFTYDADAWALRGNAEQRLAAHTEAIESYLAALRLRPNEGKWMLGAAISLAVSGKTAEAQGWVDRAKERDALTPAISAYLQQLGLNVRR